MLPKIPRRSAVTMFAVAGVVASSLTFSASATLLQYNDYFQDGKDATCTTAPANKCTVIFTPVPAGGVQLVENVSCTLVADKAATIRKWTIYPGISGGPQPSIQNALNPTALAINGITRIFQVEQPVDLLLRVTSGGVRAEIAVETSVGDITSLNCNISGRILKPGSTV